jgi:hypothetical protein
MPALTDREASLVRGLSVVSPALYVAPFHRTHKNKPLDFKNNPCMREVYADPSTDQTHIKSTQNGISEFLLALLFGLCLSGRNVFHVMPTIQLSARFVRERFDKTAVYTSLYHSRMSGSSSGADNVGMKQVGMGTTAFVGSNSPSSFTEFVADAYVIDEQDRCDESNVLMSEERLAASDLRMKIRSSNPTVTGRGIDLEYASTDQLEWHLRCDGGHYVLPDFFKHVVRQEDDGVYVVVDADWDPRSLQSPLGLPDARLVCDRCGRFLDRRGEGRWIPLNPGAGRRGRRYTKLHTTNVTLNELLYRFSKAEGNDELMERFWNADLGRAYDAPGARVTSAMIDSCRGDWPLGQVPADGFLVVGVDVGTFFNVAVLHGRYGTPGLRLVDAFACRDAQEVKEAVVRYGARCLVIDGNPEPRTSRAITALMPAGSVGLLCYYAKGRHDQVSGDVVTVDRTSALDNVKAAFATGGLGLPSNVDAVDGFYDQVEASTRIYDPDLNNGEGGYRWVEGSRPDHYFHAVGYALIAARLLTMAGRQ